MTCPPRAGLVELRLDGARAGAGRVGGAERGLSDPGRRLGRGATARAVAPVSVAEGTAALAPVARGHPALECRLGAADRGVCARAPLAGSGLRIGRPRAASAAGAPLPAPCGPPGRGARGAADRGRARAAVDRPRAPRVAAGI